MSSVQTDNSYFLTKVKLRMDNLPAGRCRVLDCFGGSGRIWNYIKQQTRRKIKILRIDIEGNKKGTYLIGDNRKFLRVLDLDQFDVIDLDAYGVPFEQLEIIFSKKSKRQKIIFVTFIQSMFGCLPDGLLVACGYNKQMIAKCPTLFYRNGFEKLEQYLAKNGVKAVKHYFDDPFKKHYLCFRA